MMHIFEHIMFTKDICCGVGRGRRFNLSNDCFDYYNDVHHCEMVWRNVVHYGILMHQYYVMNHNFCFYGMIFYWNDVSLVHLCSYWSTLSSQSIVPTTTWWVNSLTTLASNGLFIQPYWIHPRISILQHCNNTARL